MTIDMSQFIAVFFDEAAEHLANMEALLLKLDVVNPDPEELNAIFRAAHSIKGGAATFGFSDLTEVTHILENLLDRIRKNEIDLLPEMVDAFLAAGDVLKSMLDAHRGMGEAEESIIAEIKKTLTELSGAEPVSAPPVVLTAAPVITRKAEPANVAAWLIDFPGDMVTDAEALGKILMEFGELAGPETLADGFLRFSLKTARAIDELTDSLAFTADPARLRIQSQAAVPESDLGYGFFDDFPPVADTAKTQLGSSQDGDGYGFFTDLPGQSKPANAEDEARQGYGFFVPSETLPVRSEQEDGVQADKNLPTQPEKKAEKTAATPEKSSADSTVRVSVEKVDQLLNLVGELVITQSMLAQNALQLDPVVHERLLAGVAQLERNTRELQESVMSIRMMPISFVFNRYPRLVRDLAGKLGKQVELKMIGESTELDKGFIEKLADPLTHLVRNSLDHGIELPEDRLARGKAAQGTLTLKAFHQGGNIVIEVSDDGAGLSRERILAKARERGMNVSESMSDQEVWMLIFEAGFSTAAQVTDVSGRGVGMDVVRKNIQAMGGRVDIQSMFGIGSTMSIRLPLTLAILDGMSIQVGCDLYIIPLTFIVESLQPKTNEIKTMAGRGRVINVRGEYLPLIALHEIFNLEPKVKAYEEGLVIILEAEGQKIALFVDDLLGQHQVVVKNLETNYRKVQGVAGATIMGDGHVAFILDVAALVQLSQQHANASPVHDKNRAIA